MRNSTITFYPVDNGGMALIKLNDENETTLLIDLFIRAKADDEDEDEYDVVSHLREQLKTNNDDHPYVDVFLLTHNDDDHIAGIENHFHLGDPEDYVEPADDEEPKILINEVWSSSRFWKRASDSNKLSDDAKAFNREMKRRVKLFEENEEIQQEGDRARIICKDPDGKTDSIEEIVYEIESIFSKLNETDLSEKTTIKVLGPLPQEEDEESKDFDKNNRGSVILSIRVTEGSYENIFLVSGDAGVFVWECYWDKFENDKSELEYDVLSVPHHCSWHSLSHDSQSDDDPEVSSDALNALSQAKEGSYIVSSSKPIKNDDDDPPSHAAKTEYLKVVDPEDHFLCTGEYPKEEDVEPIVINLTSSGPQRKQPKAKAKLASAATAATGEAFGHG